MKYDFLKNSVPLPWAELTMFERTYNVIYYILCIEDHDEVLDFIHGEVIMDMVDDISGIFSDLGAKEQAIFQAKVSDVLENIRQYHEDVLDETDDIHIDDETLDSFLKSIKVHMMEASEMLTTMVEALSDNGKAIYKSNLKPCI